MLKTDHDGVSTGTINTQPQKITCTVCAGWGKVEVYATPAHKAEVPCRRCQGTGKQHLMGVA